MSDHAPAVRDAHAVVGFDGTPSAMRALDTAIRLLATRPGRVIVLWVGHLTPMEELSAEAVAIVEGDFDEVARELRAQAAERIDESGLPWSFEWRQGAIAHELMTMAERIQAEHPDDIVSIVVGSSTSAAHRVVGSVAVNLARHSPVPVVIVP
ncbi:MAG TPA: universal stress protein [Streptosporangiaceae bacterium]|jgi:nucleotide-binding universal stress UspA family protein